MGQYSKGVDDDKSATGRKFSFVDRGIFPYAFCNIYRDDATGRAKTQKGDGVGSKSVQRYIHSLITGDTSVFEGDADDAFLMNAGDVSCSGLFDDWMYTDNTGMNQLYTNKEAWIEAINKRMGEIKEIYAKAGIPFIWAGGETADLVDQLRTYVFDATISAFAPMDKVVTCDDIAPGDVIMGVRSGGPCKLESKPNSGLMSNGATSARHVLMVPKYALEHPEIADPKGDPYTGRFEIGDKPAGLGGMEISEAIISPTRHFPLIIRRMLQEFGADIHGIAMCTGGGATKCTRIGNDIKYIKDNMLTPDPLFLLIQEESGKTWEAMYKSFNMGVGLDVVVHKSSSDDVKKLIESEFGVGCERIGHCEQGEKNGKNHVLITGKFGNFEYEAE